MRVYSGFKESEPSELTLRYSFIVLRLLVTNGIILALSETAMLIVSSSVSVVSRCVVLLKNDRMSF